MLSVVSLTVLSLLLTLSKDPLSLWLIAQLSASIPLFASSSLSYSKMLYRPVGECPHWDYFGWITHSLGYGLLLNGVIMLLDHFGYRSALVLFVVVVVLLYTTYSILDVTLERKRLRERTLKMIFYLLVLLLGGVLPVVYH